MRRELHDTQGAASAVEFLAWSAAAGRNFRRAARLLGATARQWHAAGGSPFAAGQWRVEHDRCESATRKALGSDGYDAEFQCGGELTLDEAVSYALGEAEASVDRVTSDGPRLTRREQEIAELVAQGLSNRQISRRLVISQRTAESHVENILTKFGFTNRTQIAVWYAQQHHPTD